jgi:hypothetical protein
VYTVSNLIVVVELLRVEVGGRNRARWPQTTGGRKLGHPAYWMKRRTGHLHVFRDAPPRPGTIVLLPSTNHDNLGPVGSTAAPLSLALE